MQRLSILVANDGDGERERLCVDEETVIVGAKRAVFFALVKLGAVESVTLEHISHYALSLRDECDILRVGKLRRLDFNVSIVPRQCLKSAVPTQCLFVCKQKCESGDCFVRTDAFADVQTKVRSVRITARAGRESGREAFKESLCLIADTLPIHRLKSILLFSTKGLQLNSRRSKLGDLVDITVDVLQQCSILV